jgi:MarR-like DNA-binding transcriptional regulator SgrR of sgrS sRNA
MSRTSSLFPVLVSLALLAASADAARPRYGGVLRIESQATMRAVDPSIEARDAGEASLRDLVLPLLFETLVAVDPAGGVRPLLAVSWTSDETGSRWRFTLRSGVTLHDGTRLDAAQVASALRSFLAPADIVADGNVVRIDVGSGRPDLLWELAQPRRAIVVRAADGRLMGSGPFRVDRLESGRLLLSAHDQHWGGRPFLDGARIEFGRSAASQLTSLETGRADFVELRPTDARRLAQRQLGVVASRPLELIALVFEGDGAAAADWPLRRTLSAGIDRGAMVRVLLQGNAEAADALLPTWLSGYPASVITDATRPLSRSAVTGLPEARRSFVLRVTAGDAVAQAVADRVAVDAREAGFLVTVQAPIGLAPRADARLVRMPLMPISPDRSLAALMTALGPRTVLAATREPAPVPGASLDAVARAELALLEQFVIVPVVHLPALYGTSERVDAFNGSVVLPTGAWNLANVWLQPARVGP